VLRFRQPNSDNRMVLMLCSSVHSIGSQMHNGRADLLFPTTHRNGRRAIILRGWARRFTRAVLPAGDKPTGTLRDQAVKILPMHSARGLQFRIVLLLWADLLPSPFKSRDDGIDRGLLYVAMTRAEDMLVILHSGSSSYVEELYRVLGTVPP
jgi:superfamily I DNA/RNA helicase